MQTHTKVQGVFVLGGIALALGALFDWLFWDGGLGINFTLFVAAVIAGSFFLTTRYKKPLSNSELVLLVPIVFFALMVSVRASILLTICNMLAVALLFLVAVRTYTGKPLKQLVPEEYVRTILLPFQFIPTFFDACAELFAFRKVAAGHPQTREVIRGTVMAVVGLIFFSWLLASADVVFARVFDSLFSFTIDQVFVGHVIRIAFVGAFFVGAFGYVFRKVHAETQTMTERARARTFGELETMIFLGSICALFFAFIVLQVTYLFGGEAHFVAQGITYAEYARKGFYELVLVAVFSYLIISVAEKQIIKKEHAHLGSFKLLSGILVAEVVLILVSAWTRLALYESAYGFSTIRLYSHALMAWIGVMLVLMALHIYSGSSRATFALRALASVIALLFVMNMLNPDAFIAKQNLARYAATGKIDTFYLADLSDDAIPYTIVLLDDTDVAVRDRFKNNLQWARNNRTHVRSPWKSFTLSQMRADTLLAPRMTFDPSQQIELIVGDQGEPQAVPLTKVQPVSAIPTAPVVPQ